jgi:hypothetical protein
MRFTHDQAGRLERVHEVGDVARRAAQELAELALGRLRLMLQVPEQFSPGARQAALRQSRVHACRQHRADLSQLLEQARRWGPDCSVARIMWLLHDVASSLRRDDTLTGSKWCMDTTRRGRSGVWSPGNAGNLPGDSRASRRAMAGTRRRSARVRGVSAHNLVGNGHAGARLCTTGRLLRPQPTLVGARHRGWCPHSRRAETGSPPPQG